jgi:hypothetical protein
MELDFTALRWLLMVIGIVYMITSSVIFGPFRVWLTKDSTFRRTLFYCAACTGFWVGVGLGLASYWPMDYGVDPISALLEAVESGFAAMAVGAAWSVWYPSAAFTAEAHLRGEDPETYEPREDADEDDAA